LTAIIPECAFSRLRTLSDHRPSLHHSRSAHPRTGKLKIERQPGALLDAKIRDLFSTQMFLANLFFNSRWVRQLSGTQSHVVMRL
jgi:hypothetical protein